MDLLTEWRMDEQAAVQVVKDFSILPLERKLSVQIRWLQNKFNISNLSKITLNAFYHSVCLYWD